MRKPATNTVEEQTVELDDLMPQVYDELCRLASHQLRREGRDHTLQTSGLVHEAYLRLASHGGADWSSRLHFLRIAARMMRRILVDHARRRHADKRGGAAERLSLDHIQDWIGDEAPDLLQLDDALERLNAADAEQAKVVELKFFGGLTNEEVAEALGVSLATVKRRWQFARAWLYCVLSDGPSGGT